MSSQYASLYTEEERRILRLNYSIYFTRSDSKVRDIANALKGKCHDEPGILKAYYPYQTPEGRPLKRLRDRKSGEQVWKLIKITNPMALQVLTKCVYAFIDHKYGEEPKIEIHQDGEVVSEGSPSLPTEKQPKKQRVVISMTGNQIKDILEQIASGKSNRKQVYQCCGCSFDSVYEFRKHLYLEHPEELRLYFEEALAGGIMPKPTAEAVHKMASKGKKIKEKAEKKKEERKVQKRNRDAYPTPAKGDSFHLVYTPMGNKK